ncbi:MAG: phosphoglucosamine mutase, partial [Bacteroidota bacterium]
QVAFIKSISGFRGTIGGAAGNNLTPQDIVECTAAYGSWLLTSGKTPKVVIGRDARPSGQMVNQLVCATLQGLGIDVVDLGLSTTPTVEMAVPKFGAGGGIILTASHNPKEWNALKLLNEKGEFISGADGKTLLKMLDDGAIHYAQVDDLGHYQRDDSLLDYHIEKVLAHPLVHADQIKAADFKVVVDGVNPSGSIAIPALLKALGCEVEVLNGEPNWQFAHNPEPLPAHLTELCETVKNTKADLGIAVDPDVDRLALVGPGGSWIGEEYTLVTVADYVLQHQPGPTVSNLSSSRALRDLTHAYGQEYYASAVGEVNVVAKMKAVGAVIGGEGNGGIIDPALHYGRDSLIGAALVLSHLALSGKDMNTLKAAYATYHMVKDKVALAPDLDVEGKLAEIEKKYSEEAAVNTIDGVKLDFEQGWIHLRRSNTEPIVRIYGEADTPQAVKDLVERVKADFAV